MRQRNSFTSYSLNLVSSTVVFHELYCIPMPQSRGDDDDDGRHKSVFMCIVFGNFTTSAIEPKPNRTKS